jgi:hypothetical protein
MIRVNPIFSSLFFVTVAACSSQRDSQQLNIGEVDTLGESLSDYAATWEGYAEAYQFGPNQEFGDNILLSLDANGVGHLRVGNAALAASATDPDAVYPPSVGPDTRFGGDPGSYIALGFPSGVDYPLNNVGITEARLKFDISTNDAIASWCSLQTPYEDGASGNYACVPNAPYGGGSNGCYLSIDGIDQPTSCFKIAACHLGCDCDEAGCTAVAGAQVSFDAVLEDDGETLTGTLVFGSERIAVRMTRVD